MTDLTDRILNTLRSLDPEIVVTAVSGVLLLLVLVWVLFYRKVPPFQKALVNGAARHVRYYLKTGLVNPNIRDETGKTPLMVAAAFNKSPAVCAVLIKAGADVTAKDNDGMTAFLHAAANNAEVGRPQMNINFDSGRSTKTHVTACGT